MHTQPWLYLSLDQMTCRLGDRIEKNLLLQSSNIAWTLVGAIHMICARMTPMKCGRTVRINKNTIILPIKKRNAKKTIQKTTLLRYLLWARWPRDRRQNPTWSLDHWAYKGFHILLNQYVLSYHWTITKEPYRTNHQKDHRIQRRSRTTQKSIEYYFTSSRK